MSIYKGTGNPVQLTNNQDGVRTDFDGHLFLNLPFQTISAIPVNKGGKTAQELLTGQLPDLSVEGVCGTLAYVTISHELQSGPNAHVPRGWNSHVIGYDGGAICVVWDS